MLKPSNQKVFLGYRFIYSKFIENPQGIITLNLHRLVKINDNEFAEYVNNNEK